MISGVYSHSKYVTITGGNPGLPQIYSYNSGSQCSGAQSFAGEIRFNTSMQCLEIFDGSAWRPWAASSANVALSARAEQLLDWAERKMQQEQHLQELMDKHPGLREAQERLDIMKTLVLEQEANQ